MQRKKYKNAIMKKLLTGEVRFKGFSERWRLKSLDELAIFKNGKGEANITWMHNENDDDMLEAGEDYKSILSIPFNIVSFVK